MSQLAAERQPSTVFIGTHVDFDTRDQLRALAAEEDLGSPSPCSRRRDPTS